MLQKGLVFIILVIVISVSGQEPDSMLNSGIMNLGLEELAQVKVKVSTVRPTEILSTPSNVTIIDSRLIEQYNIQSLAEALSLVPGIDVLQTIIDRNVTTSRGILQNFYSNKVLFMIDNVPNWQPIYGDFHLERIDINDVDRIEVLKGPASVLYGTNAYSGVVNIILKDNKANKFDAHAQIGYPTMINAGGNYLHEKHGFKLFLSANASFDHKKPYLFEGDTLYPYNGSSNFSMKEKYQTGNFLAKVKYRSHSMLINGFSYSHTYFGAQPSYAMGGGTVVNNEGLLVNYQIDHQLNDKTWLVGNAGADLFHRVFALSADRTNIVKISGIRYAAEAKIHQHLGKHISYDLGGHLEIRDSRGHETWNGLNDSLVRSNLTNDNNIYESSLFFQPEFSYGLFTLVVGGRYTINSLFGNDLSFRGTVNYRINSINSLKAIVGQSFRVPTMFELYFDHPTVLGNMDLLPEKSISYELAYLRSTKTFHFGLAAYLASYYDLISRVSVANQVPVYQNTQDFQGAGIEIESKYSREPFGSFFLNYNYITSINNTGTENYKHVPEHTISFGLNKKIKKFYLFSNGQYISSSFGAFEKIDPQLFVDVGGGAKVMMHKVELNHTFTVKNITNSKFLTSQYIREQSSVNALPTMAYGRTFIYTLIIRY